MPDFEYRLPIVLSISVHISADTESDALGIATDALNSICENPVETLSDGFSDEVVSLLGVESLDGWLPTPWPHLCSTSGGWIGPELSWRYRDPYYNGEAVECDRPVVSYVRGDFIISDVVSDSDGPGFRVITYSAGHGVSGPTFGTLDEARAYVEDWDRRWA